MIKHGLVTLTLSLAAPPALAEITASGPDHYTLHHEAVSALPPDVLWTRLIDPASWWHPAHTYSGKAENLSLDAQAGGVWREDWNGGSVAHGTVLSVLKNRQLRLNAPFGPLQGMGVNVVWTITLEADETTGGTRVSFDEVASGASVSALDGIAPAVDGVKQQAMERLVAIEAGP